MSGADRRRKAVILAGAVAAHGAVLAALALKTVAPDLPPGVAAPLYLNIAPRPLLKGERPRPPQVAPAASRPATGAVATPTVRPLVRPGPADEEEDEAVILPSSQDQGVDPLWRVRPETADERAAQAIRAAGVGCHPATRTLTPAEQASCDRRLADAAREATPLSGTGDAARDAALARQGAQALSRYEARRAPLSGGVGVVGPADCVGSNLGMGCAGGHLAPVPGVDMRQGSDSLSRMPGNQRD